MYPNETPKIVCYFSGMNKTPCLLSQHVCKLNELLFHIKTEWSSGKGLF